MKIAAYSCREDELEFFNKFGRELEIELVLTEDAPRMGNLELAKDCDAVSVITTAITPEIVEIWHSYGVKAISTRTIGYEHVDYKRAAQLGIAVSNVSYSPNTVAEYAVMCMLMAIRKMKTILFRGIGQDYSLHAIRGREIKNMTVGVVGTGRIGETVIKNLSGFGSRILAYDLFEKDSVKEHAEYAPLERIWREADIITLHAPATSETHHIVNKESISKMKDGVIIVNTARGSLIDTPAFIEALECGKVGAAALDVVENEMGIYYKDFKYKQVLHREMAILSSMPNVLMTPHTAFFTDEAVSNMIEYSLKSCIWSVNGEDNPWRVN